MKEIKGQLGRKTILKSMQTYNAAFSVGFCIFLIFLVGCGGKLGTIEVQEVDTLISQAEKAIDSAREVNASSLAFEEFEKAETELEKAKEALTEKNGVDALKHANMAITHAKIAKREALQNTMNAEANANILAKDAVIVELRKKIATEETKITNLQDGIQQLRETEANLNQTIKTLEGEIRENSKNKRVNEQKVAELNTNLKSIQDRVIRAEDEVKNYGRQLGELSRKLEAAETMAKSESRQKRAAVAEAESLRKQMREQAKIYTAKLAEANKRNIAAEHAEYLKQKKSEARAFADQLPSNSKPPRTGRTSLSTQQINAGKAAMKKWENAWSSKNLNAHFAFYTPNATVNKIVVQESKENQTVINKKQMESLLQEMNTQPWKKTEELSEVEQDSVIGIYMLSRLVSPAETEDDTALYEIWKREVWAHQVQGQWKIYRETWQIYKNIPKL